MRFWEDVWLRTVPLRLIYPEIYEKCRNKQATVAECWDNGCWGFDFHRTFREHERERWDDLLTALQGVALNDRQDSISWALEKKGVYTTKSMYRMLAFRGVSSKRATKLWKCKIPLKIKIFLWLTFQDRLPTGEVLKKRKWKGDHHCTMCNKLETADHVLFHCVFARFVWACFREALGWDRSPTSMTDFLAIWLPIGGTDYNVKLFSLAAVTWTLWTSRNKMAIEKKLPKSPTDLLFKIALVGALG